MAVNWLYSSGVSDSCKVCEMGVCSGEGVHTFTAVAQLKIGFQGAGAEGP